MPDRRALGAALELLKPVTWFAPMWAFGCGAVSSGVPLGRCWPVAILGMVLAGPLMCGASQAINDWFDRDVDRINEPGRPIPSGRLPGLWGLRIAAAWMVLALAVSTLLGPWVWGTALFGMVLAWVYSAPPLRLKRSGWLGPAAVGLSYEGLPWFAGAAACSGALPDGRIVAVAALYSLGCHGIMCLNDFKAVEGDRRQGVRTLPVQLGMNRACRLACVVMVVPQLAVAGLLVWWNRPLGAAAIDALVVVQLCLMPRLLRDPRAEAPRYNATGTLCFVLGMLGAAIALRGGFG
ncbi:MAG: chlorophyll synthase ChlG [Gluconacetobacter diazotrophicus]|nr:chlorophyll synthase ChlG [Gluconacetobacter diazotrophicus]